MLIAGLDGIYIPAQARGRSFAHTNALSLPAGPPCSSVPQFLRPNAIRSVQKVLMCRERATPANRDTEMKSP